MSLKRKRNLFEDTESGEDSDVTLCLSDGTEIYAHRIFLRSCKFFDNALKPGRFKEGVRGVIEMKDDPPEAVRCLVQFLYDGYYSISEKIDKLDPEAVDDNEPDDEELKLEERGQTNMLPKESNAAVISHADVYVVAVVYQLPPLQKQASTSIRLALKTGNVIDIFPQLVHLVYSSVPMERCTLRKHLLRFAKENVTILTSGETFVRMVELEPEFMAQVMNELGRAEKQKNREVKRLKEHIRDLHNQFDAMQGATRAYRCNCGEYFEMAMSVPRARVGCPGCKRMRLASTWAQYEE